MRSKKGMKALVEGPDSEYWPENSRNSDLRLRLDQLLLEKAEQVADCRAVGMATDCKLVLDHTAIAASSRHCHRNHCNPAQVGAGRVATS
jgi:hypothetical protein